MMTASIGDQNNPKKITKQEMQFLLFNSPTDIKIATARINVGNQKKDDEDYVCDCLDKLNEIATKLNKKNTHKDLFKLVMNVFQL